MVRDLAKAETAQAARGRRRGRAHRQQRHEKGLARAFSRRKADHCLRGRRSGRSRRELVVGCVHGDEAAGIAIADGSSDVADNVDLWVVPVLDPDGVAAGSAGTRTALTSTGTSPPLADADRRLLLGSAPLSEPESRTRYRLIRRVRPQVSIWFHQHLDVVDESGGQIAVERRFAALVGLPLRRLTRESGSVVGWTNHILPRSASFVSSFRRARCQSASLLASRARPLPSAQAEAPCLRPLRRETIGRWRQARLPLFSCTASGCTPNRGGPGSMRSTRRAIRPARSAGRVTATRSRRRAPHPIGSRATVSSRSSRTTHTKSASLTASRSSLAIPSEA